MSIINQETKTPSSVLALCRELDIKTVVLRFTDLRGHEHGVPIPVHELREDSFEYGFGMSAAGLPGYGTERMTEMVLVPLPETGFFDPFASIPTLNLLCSLRDPVTDEDDPADPRAVARKAADYLIGSTFADRVTIGIDIMFELSEAGANGDLDSLPNLDSRSTWEDRCLDVYSELLRQLTACRVQIDSQCLRVPQFHPPQTSVYSICVRGDCPVRAADAVMLIRYLIPRIAAGSGMRVRLPPGVEAIQFGCGMSVSLSFLKANEPILAGTEYAGLSQLAMGVIGGLLNHGPSLLGLTFLPSELPSNGKPQRSPWSLAYSRGNPETLVRIPQFSSTPKSKRIEFRGCDATSNPYLAISAILMAGIEGGLNKTNPGQPCEPRFPNTQIADEPSLTPGNMGEMLAALRTDRDYLTRGEVFSEHLLECWVESVRIGT